MLWAALLVMAAGPASAQSGDGTASANDEEARARFEAGERALARSDFEAALQDFERAYALSPRPGLLFNIGLAAQRARRRERALEAFREYLRLVPEAPNRADVEARIADLEDLLAADASEGEPTPAAESTTAPIAGAGAPPPRDDGGPGAMPIVLLATGGALAVGGVVLLALAGSAVSEVEGSQPGTPWTDVESSYDAAPTLSTIGAIGLGLGVAAAGVGVVLLATGGSSETDTAAALRIGPGTVAIQGSF